MKQFGWRMAAVLLAAAVLLFLLPRIRVRAFTTLHSGRIENALAYGNGIPGGLGIKAVNTWEGEHTMTEIILGYGFGDCQYYGCYYSPDDVPLAFQNVETELAAVGKTAWTWADEQGNHGMTSRLKDGWCYFEASF